MRRWLGYDVDGWESGLRMGCTGSSQQQQGEQCRNSVKTLEDILLRIHATTSHLLEPKRETLVPMRENTTQCMLEPAWTMDIGWLGTWSFVLYSGAYKIDRTISPAAAQLSENPHIELFGSGIELGTHPSLTLSGVLTTAKADFRILAYLGVALVYYGKWRGGESANTDGDHFERAR